MASRIPVENVYFLLIYAWDRLAEGALVDISGIDTTELVDLYAAVLLSGLRHLLRRGLDQSYLSTDGEMASIGGRIKVAPTMRRMLMHRGRAYCEHDELSVDSVPNRILLATVRRLRGSPSLDPQLARQLRDVERLLGGITPAPLERRAFRTVQLHTNNGFYRFLLNVCELVLDSSIPTEEPGRFRFRDFLRDPVKMSQVFEEFVFNFYRTECPHIDVRRERIRWAAGSVDDPSLEFLPMMQTDISLRWPGKTLVIDAKYYQETFQRHFEVATVHSAHMYQMFSYLKNLEARGGQDASAEGLLLYPRVDESVRLRYEVHGHALRICTVDLGQGWKKIRQELLQLADN